MQRRELLKTGAAIAGGWAASRVGEALPSPAPIPIPIIDTHIHLFDPGRPGGVPWPAKTDTALYKAALPERYESLAGPFGVVGAIVIEASNLASDNDWVLNVAANHPIIVGMVGDLIPGTPDVSKGTRPVAREPSLPGPPVRQFVGPRSGRRRQEAGISCRTENVGRAGPGDG